MSTLKAIRTEADYQAALARANALMDAAADTPEGQELDVLADLIEMYETRYIPLGLPSVQAAIEFRLEQSGLSQRDLIPLLGSRSKVSEVLTGKRPLSMQSARALHEHLGIPAEVLLNRAVAETPAIYSTPAWSRYPIKAMAKLGWVTDVPDIRKQAEAIVRSLAEQAGLPYAASMAMYRKSQSPRANVKTDPYALEAWCWKVLATAKDAGIAAPYRPGTITPEFLRELAQISSSEQGPADARDFLRAHGIALVVVPHLPRTYLDGAALHAADGRPVIGLTLRHDRIDNFWFCLLHELAHVGRHMEGRQDSYFIDDQSLRDSDAERQDPQEREADAWAEEALIPESVWASSPAREDPTPIAIINLAQNLRIHPAIVAGRVRHERRDFRLLSQFVGNGVVRRYFI